MKPKISVIIPVHNDSLALRKTIHTLKKQASIKHSFELIISSTEPIDGYEKVVVGPQGRGTQLALGAENSRGSVLLFLHADTQVPQDWDALIIEKIDSGFACGAFYKRFDTKNILLRIIALGANLRARLFFYVYGDNGMFLTREAYQSIGGFDDVPIFEDVMMAKKMKRLKYGMIAEKLVTSSRRFQENGVLSQLLLNLSLQIQYHVLGVGPKRLAVQYEKRKRKGVFPLLSSFFSKD